VPSKPCNSRVEYSFATPAVAQQPLINKQSAGSDRQLVLGPLPHKPIRNGECKSKGNVHFSRSTNAGRAPDDSYDLSLGQSSDDLSDVTVDSMNAPKMSLSSMDKRSCDRTPLSNLNLDNDDVPHRGDYNSKAHQSQDSSREVPVAGRKNRFKKLPPIPLSVPYKPVPVDTMR